MLDHEHIWGHYDFESLEFKIRRRKKNELRACVLHEFPEERTDPVRIGFGLLR